ncbi:hypothetical protein M758_10G051400 [Ceratodon purpureus]|nr:hypothetical protein M758_10G051400 [Ceratodon purpureus]
MAGFREHSGCRWNFGLVGMILVMVMVKFTSAVPIPAPDLPDNCNSEERCCMPRPYRGKPVRQFEYDPTLPVRFRRAAHLIDEEYIAKLERGVKLQRELPDTDPRSWTNQMNLHCLYCDNGLYYPNQTWPLEVHNGWLFLPWHRMFMYFNERILAKLLDDDTFALPFWNWDNQTPEEPHANILPYFYARNKTSSLWNKNRNNCSEPPLTIDLNTEGGCTTKTPEELRIQNNRLIYTQIVTGAPTSNLFFGMPYSYGDAGATGAGTFEDNPHGTVHFWLGDPNPEKPAGPFDDMGNFGVAARDPAFYGHHANIDRIWTIWKTLPGAQRKEPTHPDFLDAQFTFYDENADLVIVNVSQTLNRTLLRYEYEEMPAAWTTNGELAGQENNVTLCNPATAAETTAMIGAADYFSPDTVFFKDPITFRVARPAVRNSTGVEVLEFSGVDFAEPSMQVHWRSYLFYPTAVTGTSAACPEFAGAYNYVAHPGMAIFKGRNRKWRVALDSKLVALGKQNLSDIVVTLAQFGPTIQPVQFAKVEITYDTS